MYFGRVVFVAGKPGSGKGTQCKRVAARYGYQHVSACDLLQRLFYYFNPLIFFRLPCLVVAIVLLKSSFEN